MAYSGKDLVESKKLSTGWTVVIIIGLVVLGIVVGSDPDAARREREESNGDSSHTPNSITDFQAKEIVEATVMEALVSPGSARFPWSSFPYDYSPYVKRLARRDGYRVEAWVDSQNKFGGLLRSEFVCTVEYVGDRYQITEFNIHEKN